MKDKTKFLVIAMKSTKILKILKSAKLLKGMFSMLSAMVFAACYSVNMGIALALAFTLLLFVHEAGHVVAAYRHGFGLKLPVFIPFLGAAIFVPKFDCRAQEASVGIGGPIVGSLAAMAMVVPYFFTGSMFWIAAAILGLTINLFNLIPLSPLDGGRITQVVHPNFQWLGWGLLLACSTLIGEPGMLLIWILCLLDVRKIPYNWRRLMATGLWLVMVTLTACGYHRYAANHSNWPNWVDVICAAIILALHWFLDTRQAAELDDSLCDLRPVCEPRTRIGYFLSWSVLSIVLLVSIFELAKLAHP